MRCRSRCSARKQHYPLDCSMSCSQRWLPTAQLPSALQEVHVKKGVQSGLISKAPNVHNMRSVKSLLTRSWLTKPPPHWSTAALCVLNNRDNRSTPEGTDAAVSGSKQTAPLQPEENIQARWQRLGPYPPTGFHVDKNPVPLGSEEDGWCGLCGVRSGWMQCGRCSGEGDYLTLPGRAGVKDKVGRARCKMCFGRGAVPCVLCGLPDMERWNQWHAYAKRNPVKKKSQ